MSKIVIYQIFTRLFCNNCTNPVKNGDISRNGCGKMELFNDQILRTIRQQGATHIWFTGIIAHASVTDYSSYGIPTSHPSTVKGIAGSPYAIRDYYDIDPDLAIDVKRRHYEFSRLVKRVHKNGMKFIIDFVPNHVARQYNSIRIPKKSDDLGYSDNVNLHFSTENNFYYMPGKELSGEIDWQDYREFPAKATGNDRFNAYPTICDWYETIKLNYGVNYTEHYTQFSPIPNTWYKMRDILLFWASKGVDAFRCDMAEMVPVEFWHWAISSIKALYPDILFIAELYNPGAYKSYTEYGLFDYIYDKVGLYDTLRSVTVGQQSATAITACWQRYGEIGDKMLHFMENHDEQRIASSYFAGSGVKGRAAMIVSSCFDCAPIMYYAGQELGEKGMDQEGYSGEDGRTTIFDYWAPDTLSRWYREGELSDKHLTKEEVELKSFYKNLLNIAIAEPAIGRGKFFDLMYVNPASGNFDAHKEYAFIRQYGDDILLIVANFSDKQQFSQIVVPPAAFDYLEIPPITHVLATELLTNGQIYIDFSPNIPIGIHIPANSGVILKIER